MRIVRILLAVALVSGLLTALYILITERRGSGPTRVVDPQDWQSGDPSAQPDPNDVTLREPPDAGDDQDATARRLCESDALTALPATLFGHARQTEVDTAFLVAPPSGFNLSNCTSIHRDMAPSLRALLAAARRDNVSLGRDMAGVSCFRAQAKQRDLYCNAGKIASRGYQGQAYWVAPPGYSEHATGLTIDFGDRSRPECNVNPCFGETSVGQWLARNAQRFGFKLSFPEGNAQGVANEPWHFTFVRGAASRSAGSAADTISARRNAEFEIETRAQPNGDVEIGPAR